MLLLVLAFAAFLALIALAPRQIVQLGLAAFWVLLAAGCAVSVVQALVR